MDGFVDRVTFGMAPPWLLVGLGRLDCHRLLALTMFKLHTDDTNGVVARWLDFKNNNHDIFVGPPAVEYYIG